MTPKKDIPAVQEAAGLPAYMQGQESVPSGRMDDEEGVLALPRLKLLQDKSDEVKQDTAPAGAFWSQSHSVALPEEFELVCLRTAREWIKFDSDFNLEWRAGSRNDPRVQAESEAFRLETFHFLCVGPIGADLEPLPFVWSMRGLANKHCSRAWYREMRMKRTDGREAQFFEQIYRATKWKDKDNGNWYPKCRFARFVTEEEGSWLLDLARKMIAVPLAPDMSAPNGGEVKGASAPETAAEAIDSDIPF